MSAPIEPITEPCDMAKSDSGLEQHLYQRQRVEEIQTLAERHAEFKEAERVMRQADKMLASHGPTYRKIVNNEIDRMFDAYFQEKRLRERFAKEGPE